MEKLIYTNNTNTMKNNMNTQLTQTDVQSMQAWTNKKPSVRKEEAQEFAQFVADGGVAELQKIQALSEAEAQEFTQFVADGGIPELQKVQKISAEEAQEFAQFVADGGVAELQKVSRSARRRRKSLRNSLPMAG